MEFFGLDSAAVGRPAIPATGAALTAPSRYPSTRRHHGRRHRGQRHRHAILAVAVAATAIFNPIASRASAGVTCKPILSVKNVREVRTSTFPQPWSWKATISVDRTFCATKSGSFEIDFVRIKEYSPDLQFTEKFQWVGGQFDVEIELEADESVLDYRIGFIAPCVCRDFPE